MKIAGTGEQLWRMKQTAAGKHSAGAGEGVGFTMGSRLGEKLAKKSDSAAGQAQASPEVDDIGMLLRGLDVGEEKKVVHNGVQVKVECMQCKDGGRKYVTTVGMETAGSQWYTVLTRDGFVKVDLNDIGGILSCMDLFSSETVNKLMEVVQFAKIAKGIDQKIASMLSEGIDKLADSCGSENSGGSVQTKAAEEQVEEAAKDTMGTSAKTMDEQVAESDQ